MKKDYYWEKHLNNLSNCKSLLRGCVKTVIEHGLNQSELCERTNFMFSIYCKNAPRWLKSELNGYLDALKDTILESAICFAYVHEGRLYGTKKNGPFPHYDESGVDIKDIYKLQSGFFHIKSGKPYFFRGE